MLHSIFVGMNAVDAFLVTQALLPDRGLEDADGSMDTFVTKLVAQMLPPAPLLEPPVMAGLGLFGQKSVIAATMPIVTAVKFCIGHRKNGLLNR
jgi:hypothetical protein